MSNSETNAVVILSDDEEDVLILNEHGKRTRYTEEDDEEGEEEKDEGEEEKEEEQDEEEEDYYDSEEDEFDQDEEFDDYHDMTELNQTLPEDHESAIFSERTEESPYKEIDQAMTEFKEACVDTTQDDIETGFACGSPLKDNAPDIAMNVQGVIGPITFPLSLKDINRVLSTRPPMNDGFSLDTSEILLNLSFQEYLFETLLPEIVTHLGLNKLAGKNTRLQAHRFYIREADQELKLPDPVAGAFGTMLLILPCDFNAGNIVMEYNGEDNTFQPGSDAMNQAYYVAWYNNVKTSFLPLSSGHQVAILFSLIYDGPDKTINTDNLQQARITLENGELSPDQLIQAQPYLEKMKQFLQSEPVANSPYPYFYMLNYSYIPPCMKHDQLKKSDKVLVNTLAKVAQEAGMTMYIGGIEREVEGKIYPDDEEIEDSECPMDEEGIFLTLSANYDEYILKSLVDEHGRNVLKRPIAMDSKEHRPIIQGISWYARCKPDSQEISGTKRDIKYWYANHTALVFVPKTCALD
ncbi:hypothetical protein INT47_011129 [Mucor saturninus]|uniref:Uncharacterized protein n=1 Tax=Mucor saturninus TaxID=64648 RepID=A0A8H7VC46_9FUNG|nr:hypothetical protein INT47_011129 [Mucor saturninus]